MHSHFFYSRYAAPYCFAILLLFWTACKEEVDPLPEINYGWYNTGSSYRQHDDMITAAMEWARDRTPVDQYPGEGDLGEYPLTFDGTLGGEPLAIRASQGDLEAPWRAGFNLAYTLHTTEPTVSIGTSGEGFRPEFKVSVNCGSTQSLPNQPYSLRWSWSFFPPTDVDFSAYPTFVDATLVENFVPGSKLEIAPGGARRTDSLWQDVRPRTLLMINSDLTPVWMEQPPFGDKHSIEVISFRRAERSDGIEYWVELDLRQSYTAPIFAEDTWTTWPETLDIEGRLKFNHFEPF